MTLDELAHAVWSRGGELRLVDGRIRYRGPTLAPDDPIRAAVRDHRVELVRLLTPAPRPRSRFAPGPPYFEPVPGHSDTWQETAWSAARCVYGDGDLAPDDRLHCPAHAAMRSAGAAEAVAGGQAA